MTARHNFVAFRTVDWLTEMVEHEFAKASNINRKRVTAKLRSVIKDMKQRYGDRISLKGFALS